MNTSLEELKKISKLIREDIIVTGRDCEVGVHLGGNLTLAEIMAVLFFSEANVDPENPDWEARDRIILSKGHGNLALPCLKAQQIDFVFDYFLSYFSLIPSTKT